LSIKFSEDNVDFDMLQRKQKYLQTLFIRRLDV